MMVMTSKLEMGNWNDPLNTLEHTCREILRIFDYIHDETIQACVDHYKDLSKEDQTYPLVRDVYHSLAVRECQINTRKERWGSEKEVVVGKSKGKDGFEEEIYEMIKKSVFFDFVK